MRLRFLVLALLLPAGAAFGQSPLDQLVGQRIADVRLQVRASADGPGPRPVLESQAGMEFSTAACARASCT